MRLSSPVSGAVVDFDPMETRTDADSSNRYGALFETHNGRFRYGKASEATTLGKLKLAPSPIANHVNQTVDSASNVAIGSKVITLDNGGTAATAGEYDQGELSINDATGEGQTLQVEHNDAAGSSADIVVTLADPVKVALVGGTSEYTLVHNVYNGFQEAASKTLRGAGVALVDIASGDFGWLKTRGVASTLIGTAASLGGELTSDGSTAGAVTDNTDQTGVDTEVRVGKASIVAGVSGEYNPIMVTVE